MTWLRVRTLVLFAVLAAAPAVLAADLPWVGQWRINVAKSDFGQSTVTYVSVGGGEMERTADGMTMKFRMDGKDYPDPVGGTAAWKQIDASTWESVYKLNDRIISTTVRKLAADGQKLTATTKGTWPNGKTFEEQSVMARVSGGPGLVGKWKTSQVTIAAPSLIVMAPFETDGLTMRVAETGTSWSAKFDGKDNPLKGQDVPAGLSIALQRTGPRSFDYVQKHNGREIDKGTLTVSSDGKTITVADTAVGTTEKTTAVYDRQ